MTTIACRRLFIGAILVAFIAQALGHSYLTNPTSRSNQKNSATGCRGPACLGPCDRSLSGATRAPISINRGDSISVEWPRNNHAGGFIRLAWARTSDSDSHSAFDNGVQQINCHEVGGCKPDDPSDPNGGDTAPSDGSRQPCRTTITVPLHLADGKYTLQWAWFGGAFELGDYYSCVDYNVAGGPTGTQLSAVYKGGDYSYPGQNKCKFFNTDRLHRCVDEPCDNPVYSGGERSGPAFGISSTVTPVTPSTTGKVTRSTTGKVTPAAPSTTGKVTHAAPSTTGKVTPAPVPTPTPTPSGSGSNCAGLTKTSQSEAEFSVVETWGTTWHAVITIQVAESQLASWYLEIVYPSGFSSSVANVYNAGKLSCQGSGHSVIKPAASWAQNLPNGYVITVEVMGTNPARKSADYIKQNLGLEVYKY